jgi:hypothetical protein
VRWKRSRKGRAIQAGSEPEPTKWVETSAKGERRHNVASDALESGIFLYLRAPKRA